MSFYQWFRVFIIMVLVDFEFCMSIIGEIKSITVATSVLITVSLMFRSSSMPFTSTVKIELSPGNLYKFYFCSLQSIQQYYQISMHLSISLYSSYHSSHFIITLFFTGNCIAYYSHIYAFIFLV